MKFAVMILFYDCDQFILRTIENCAPHVGKIYVSYSPYPWSYNPEARELYRNPSKLSLIYSSKYLGKVEVVQGEWETEEAQRNEIAEKAKAEGYDYLIIQDADEFYTSEDYQKNLNEIRSNPGYTFYKTPWYQFWKNTRYVLLCKYTYLYKGGKVVQRDYKTIIGYSMLFAIDLHSENRFERCRRPRDLDSYMVLSGVCYHLSYVLSDEQVMRKINTYGHTDQINKDYWYRYKWKAWRPSSGSLHPLGQNVWLRAIPFDGPLPMEIQDLPDPEQHSVALGAASRTYEWLHDCHDALRNRLKLVWAWVRSHKSKKGKQC